MHKKWKVGPVDFIASELKDGIYVEGYINGAPVLSYLDDDSERFFERVACASRFRVLEMLQNWYGVVTNCDIEIR